MRDNWNDCYPPFPDRPRPEDLPPWYRVEREDLAHFMRECGVPLSSLRTIFDFGSADGQRIIHAIASNPPLNRPDVHVTCIDFAPRAVMWGVDLWARLRAGAHCADYQLPVGLVPCWSMSYRNEDLLSLPRDLASAAPDLIVDWMMLHGLPLEQVPQYAGVIKRLAPRYFLLKCFSTEGSSDLELRRAVKEVDKHRWSREALCVLLGDTFDILGEPHQCPEIRDVDDGDGHRAAKREYCFVRRT